MKKNKKNTTLNSSNDTKNKNANKKEIKEKQSRIKRYSSKYSKPILGDEYYVDGVDILKQLTKSNYLGEAKIKDKYFRKTHLCEVYEIEGKTANFKYAITKINSNITLGFLLTKIFSPAILFDEDLERNKKIERNAILNHIKNNHKNINKNENENIIYNETFTNRVVITKVQDNLFRMQEQSIEFMNEMTFVNDITDIETYISWSWNPTINISFTDTIEHAEKLANSILRIIL